MDVNDNDNVFGPQRRGTFDFTLLFELTILSILPSSVFLGGAAVRLFALLRENVQTRNGSLLWLKLAAATALVGLQIPTVVLWSLTSQPYRGYAIAASVLALLVALALGVLSYLEHRRSIRPSTLLSSYLFLSILLDLAQARSLCTRPNLHQIAGVFVGSIAAKALLLFFEETPKKALLKQDVKGIAPESTSGVFSRTVFWWLNSLFRHGYKALIATADLSALPQRFESENLLTQLDSTWSKKSKKRKHALVETVLSTFRLQLVAAVIPRLCFGGFIFAQPFLINRVVKFVGERTSNFDQPIVGGLIGATALIYTGTAVSRCVYKHLTYQFLTMMRGGLISLIFQKTLALDREAITDKAPITLMSTDIDAIALTFQDIHDVWGNIIEIGVGLFILQRYVGNVGFLVVVPLVLSSVGTHFMANGIGPARIAWNRGVQKRVAVTSSLLAQMKGVKMMGLTDWVLDSIQGFRRNDVHLSRLFRWKIVLNSMIANVPYLLAPVFVIVAAVYLTKNDLGLSIAEAFTALSVMVLVLLPLSNLLVLYPRFISSLACFGRIQAFLLLDEKKDYRVVLDEFKKSSSSHIDIHYTAKWDLATEFREKQSEARPPQTQDSGASMVEIVNASFATGNDTEVLHGVTLRVPQSQVTMIMGRVGCGKSSLLEAVLGEMKISSGSLTVKTQSVAYCDQTAWLMNKAIKENILGTSYFDKKWYDRVVQACALDKDFEAIAGGDQSLVGSGGAALSGGQKQRVALARAVYARKELLLLDDVFSSLDNKTSHSVFARLLGPRGLLREEGTTVVLVTNAVDFICHADFVATLDAGSIQKDVVRPASFGPPTLGTPESELLQNPEATKSAENGAQEAAKQPKSTAAATKVVTPDSIRRTGDMKLYKFYLKSVGAPLCIGFLLMAITGVVTYKLPQIWLRIWTERGTKTDRGLFVAIYIIFAVCGLLGSAFSMGFFLLLVIPKSAQHLHLRLLRAVLAAPLSFFTTTDTGVLLNRFSQDMTLVDASLPISFFLTTFNVLNVLAEAGLIASGATYVAAVIPFCVACLWVLQKFYLRTSRQIRHLDLEAKSPLYTHFTEALSGLVTIRAFNWKADFVQANSELLDASQKPYYLLYCIQRWLNVVLDLFVAGIALVLVGFALGFRTTTSEGAIALAMVNIITFNSSLSQLINSWTDMETSLGAIARLIGFLDETPKEDKKDEQQNPPSEWPTRGEIVFQNVTAQYSPELQPTLRNISLNIKPGQKVAICGRTGSGKSSMILTLLRMLDLRSGTLLIDGIDLSTLPRQTIRSLLTTLPQDPVKLPGTVRQNLDPHGKFSTSSLSSTNRSRNGNENQEEKDILRTSLEKTGIWDIISARDGLDAEFDSIGFSTGQQQLFDLSRAILRKHRGSRRHNYDSNGSSSAPRVLLLDEATSTLDQETESRIRRVIQDEFSDCTVLEVVHKLDSLTDGGFFDLVVVLDEGRVVELGEPTRLLGLEGEQGKSRLRDLVEGSNSGERGRQPE